MKEPHKGILRCPSPDDRSWRHLAALPPCRAMSVAGGEAGMMRQVPGYVSDGA
jgi:hypothetical protein